MHTSVNSYVPELSVKDIPTGAYIQQSIDGFWARHESALPKETVPDGHVVAIVISGLSIVMYSDGHDVDGASANAGQDTNINNAIILCFMFLLLIVCS